jgi:hypothetical protein
MDARFNFEKCFPFPGLIGANVANVGDSHGSGLDLQGENVSVLVFILKLLTQPQEATNTSNSSTSSKFCASATTLVGHASNEAINFKSIR